MYFCHEIVHILTFTKANRKPINRLCLIVTAVWLCRTSQQQWPGAVAALKIIGDSFDLEIALKRQYTLCNKDKLKKE